MKCSCVDVHAEVTLQILLVILYLGDGPAIIQQEVSFILLISTGLVCYLLVDPVGPFADCHKELSYAEYYKKCIQDGCRCEGCLCNVIAGYAKACAAKDIDVNGWRNSVKPCAQGELNNFMIL